MSRLSLFLTIVFADGLLLAGSAQAHPRLVASTPANGATVSNVRLQFNEALVPAFSRAELTMTAMPGMPNHGPLKMPIRSSVSKDGRMMVVTSRSRLQPGRYRLNWHVVSTDTHRINGQVTFAVR